MTDERGRAATSTKLDEVDEVVETPQEPVEAPEESQDDEGKKGNSEAAKWRVRFREAEAELEALKSRVADMQAAEVSRLATGAGRLHDGQDLLLTATLTDLLDDEGTVDADKVAEAVAALVEKKPHLAKPAFDDGVGVGEKGTVKSPTWADVIAS